MEKLVDKNEKILFTVLAVLGCITWAALIIGTFGVALIFVALGFILYLFAQSGFISYLKGSGAIVTPQQFPDLYAMFQECCRKLEITKEPTIILIHADGIFNALATRFLKRHYVVLFSDIVDALEEEPEAIKFYIGHELGHIKRNHLIWGPVFLLVSWLPLLGAGYSRAREVTCDKHGMYCCRSREAAMKAMSALVVGGRRWKDINMAALLDQNKYTKGFWMSYHEIIADYPWMTRRLAMISSDDGAKNLPRRNPFAWGLALFTPRMSFVSLIVLYILIIGVTGATEFMKGVKEGLSEADYSEEYDYDYSSDELEGGISLPMSADEFLKNK
ncbi:MAG: M48 family metallopeptidase [Rhodospirillales bacterium]|nr:M48 family metallopeptidase [Rhodospirillales bacterium]